MIPLDVAPLPQPPDGHRVFTRQIDGRWTQNGGIQVCLAQTLHSSISAVRTGASRPHAVSALAELLNPNGHATRDYGISGGAQPGVIVAPELAIGPSDWASVDDAVRGCDRQRIVIVGCGHVQGVWIEDWLAAGTNGTSRLRGWPDNVSELLASRPYNIGFAWIKTADACQCVVFLKNFIDQGLEHGLVPNLGNGNYLLRLQASDLVVFPLICSEFHRALDTDTSPGSAARRIKNSLEEDNPGSRRLLITGSAHTDDPGNSLWERAFIHVCEHVHPMPLIAFVNGAEGIRGQDDLYCAVDPAVDMWRNRTGIYKPKPAGTERTRAQSQFTMLADNALMQGVVAREPFALAVGGEARWAPSITGGSYLWLAQVRAVFDAGGTIADIDVGTAFSYEVAHASGRRRRSHKPEASWAGSDRPELVAKYHTHLYRMQCSAAFTQTLCGALITAGPVSTEWMGNAMLIGCDMNTARVAKQKGELALSFLSTPFDPQLTQALESSLDAASAVWAIGGLSIVGVPNCLERTFFATRHQAYLVWASPWLGLNPMRREIDAWRRAEPDGARLLVIGRSMDGAFAEESRTTAMPRADLTMPEGDLGVHRPRENRTTSLLPIASVLDASRAATGEDIEALRNRLREVLDAACGIGGGGAA